MHDHLNPTPDTNNETAPAPTLPKAELDSIELQVREHLEQGDSEDDLRALTSSLLEAAGQAPLSEGETKRTFTLDIDGEESEQTLIVDPYDFGTFVRSVSELGIDGLADADQSHETDEEVSQVEHDLGKQALKDAINENTPNSPELYDDSPEEEVSLQDNLENVHVPSPELADVLNDPSLRAIDDLATQMKQRTSSLIAELDTLDRALSMLNYEGGRTPTSAAQLNNSLDSLRRISGGTVDGDLAGRTRALRNRAEELLTTVRHNEQASDDDRHKARLAEENIEEIDSAGRVIHSELEEIRLLLRPNGKLEGNIQELNRSTNGYQSTIGLLKVAVKAATEHTTMAYGRIGAIEARIQDIARLRRAE